MNSVLAGIRKLPARATQDKMENSNADVPCELRAFARGCLEGLRGSF